VADGFLPFLLLSFGDLTVLEEVLEEMVCASIGAEGIFSLKQ